MFYSTRKCANVKKELLFAVLYVFLLINMPFAPVILVVHRVVPAVSGRRRHTHNLAAITFSHYGAYDAHIVGSGDRTHAVVIGVVVDLDG